MEIKTVKIDKPDDVNLILGQSHFVKTVEDLYEVLVTELAKMNAYALSAGHAFIIFLKNAYPINVLNAVKTVPEVCHIFCATANPVEVVIAESETGRGILGVIDGLTTKGIEDEEGIAWRTGFLRQIGYKLG